MSAVERQRPQEVKIRPVAEHRRARFDFKVEEKLEAGLQLTGSEVKSLREGTVTLSDAYALPTRGGELMLHNAHIGPYGPAAAVYGHDPLRPRKLLMHRAEIDRWSSKVRERGYSIIPLSIYFKGPNAKVELGLCTGKTHEDRRHDIKARETKREMDRAIRRR
ncbi:MAG TPA: SsrA-binding protein SmpB [Myxococcales bacterium]|nr:SsrA-binding protein SmpB [Myxococcales bacterium]